MMSKIYVDYNATTPLAPEVVATITKSLNCDWGNPSSGHELGQAARKGIEKARIQIGTLVDGNAKHVTFTSGGTEANNMVIFGIIQNERLKEDYTKPHVVTTTIEHDSVALPLKYMEDVGYADVTQVPMTESGLSPDDVMNAITDATVLITIMAANNETGVILPIKEIGEKLHHCNIYRTKEGLPQIIFHSDAAQAIGKIPISVRECNIDCLTIVGHKFYGPRIGALWSRVQIPPLLFGGGQEYGRRPGTENTPMIVGLGVAAQLVVDNLEQYSNAMKSFRDEFEKTLKEKVTLSEKFAQLVVINCDSLPRLPNTTSLSFRHDFSGKAVLDNCERVLAGVGAACHSQAVVASPVLINSGVPAELAKSSIRISVGRNAWWGLVKDIVKDIEQAVLRLHRNPPS